MVASASESGARAFSFTQAFRRACQTVGDKVAVVDASASLTWNQLGDRSRRLGAALQSLGMATGDRVAMLANNCHQYIEFYFGVPCVGGIFVPLNFRLAPTELAAILADSDTRILIVDAENLELAKQVLELRPMQQVLFIGPSPTPPGMRDYEDAIARATPLDPAHDPVADSEDVVCLFYTSGSTGRPKGVMHTHSNLLCSSLAFAAQIGLTDQSIAMIMSPLFHVGAAGLCLPVLHALGCIVMVPRFEPAKVLESIETHGITVMTCVPTMLRMMIDHPDMRRRKLSTMTTILYGSSPMPEALVLEAREYLADARFTPCYGMTESTASVSSLPPYYTRPENWALGKANSIGRSLIACEMAVLDAEENKLPTGRTGEIVVRGPLVMKGYWNNPELTAQTLRNGWLHTGDLGYMDELGIFHIVDRLKDMIIAGGENVYSAEVEAAIYAYPGIAQCSVIGVPDEKWGEAVHAVICPSPGIVIEEAALLAHCQARIAKYKCPRSFDIRTESLPLSGAGKIDKPALRKPHWEGRKSKLI
ncbi:Long-chain-fatty-acid--CoA ligase [Variovorax sp. SRS16]|uniref:class I adenylate-forming enzyme family protein n=1 Tax=Variovorax sp. SRS16 TaxID=282217 RepID=UPI001319A88D|nr:long-chain-fatty-acid--CoA ligase [Variovorax sp. SRS16]VTU33694.1 Long-chain-fatty-acid--CoA ligase [Variovorax sp. SRS16]